MSAGPSHSPVLNQELKHCGFEVCSSSFGGGALNGGCCFCVHEPLGPQVDVELKICITPWGPLLRGSYDGADRMALVFTGLVSGYDVVNLWRLKQELSDGARVFRLPVQE